MGKTLCKKKKLLKKRPEAYAEMVRAPRFVCRECGRVANKKKYVCSPSAIGSETRSMVGKVA